ncbi:hypothetical protein ACOMHN_024384 [Nucella lapillus]
MTYQASEMASLGHSVFTCTATDGDATGSTVANLTYSIVGGAGFGPFSVDNATCDVTVAQQLDYEIISVYDVIIQAVDNDPVTPKSATANFTIQVTDVNEHALTFINLPELPVPVPETREVDTAILQCTVSDGETTMTPNNSQINFVITGGNEENKFSLDSTTCNLTLAEELNFENVSRYDITITAYDIDPSHPGSGSYVFSVKVEDINERPSIKNLPGDPVLVKENVSVGTDIFTCLVKDPDGKSLPRGQPLCSIVGGNEAGMFSLDPDTCKVNLSRSLDFETTTEYRLRIQALDQDAERPLRVVQPLVISIVDLNEHSPAFINVPTSPTEIGENSGTNSTVITCTANDLDSPLRPSGQLRFQITGGNEDGRFTLRNESECLVTVAQALDFETRNNYSLTLSVRDLDPKMTFSITHTFQIRVTDENDAPVLHRAPKMPIVAENSPAGTFVFECSATDQDNASLPRGQLKYVIAGGNIKDSFTLKAPCRIETTKPLDHEARVFYYLKVRVRNLDPLDIKNDTLVYKVKVTELNDNTPYFLNVFPSRNFLPESTSVGVPFLNCTGDDDDTPLEPTGRVRYDIIAGNEENFFTVNPDNCSLSLRQPVDYENTNLTFNLTLRITDLDPVAPRSAEQPIGIYVTDVNDNKPTFVRKFKSLIPVRENNPLGKHLGRCSAVDGDSPLKLSGQLRYSILSGNSLSEFYLNPYTCDLYVNGLLDFEQKRWYGLRIQATDLDPDMPLKTNIIKVKIRVLDDNDHGPTCQSSLMLVEMSEDVKLNSVVLAINCTDLDHAAAASTLRYTALNDSETLEVDNRTGKVRLIRKLDWDDVNGTRQHDLRVEVRDSWVTPISATVTVRVLLTDADDSKPVFQQEDYVGNISQTLPRGSAVLRVSATDADNPNTTGSSVQYGVHKASTPDWFLVHPYTGQIIVKRALEVNSSTESRLEVFSFSSDRSQERTVVNVTVRVNNALGSRPEFTQKLYYVSVPDVYLQKLYYVSVPDVCPQNLYYVSVPDVCPQKLYYVSVPEASTNTTPVVRVKATDPGGGQVRYSVEDGPLIIDEVTGDVRVKGQLDFETQYSYTVRVEARDSATPSLTSSATIVLTVLPRNEFDPVWLSGTSFVVSEDTVPGTVISQLSAKDDDSSWDGQVHYRSSLTPDLPFLVDQSGRLTLVAPLYPETKDSYTFPVIAYDFPVNASDRRSVTTTLTVTVSDVDDLAPKCRRVPVAVVVFPWIGSPIASVNCERQSGAGVLGYRIVSGNVDGVFEINNVTGQLTAKRRPTLDTYTLRVEVSDGGTPAMTSLVDVVILAEPELTLTGVPASVRVREDAAVGTRVHQVTACCSFTTLRVTACCSFTTLRVSTSRHITSHHPGTSCHRLLLLHQPEGEYVTSHHITRVHHVTACCSFTTLRGEYVTSHHITRVHHVTACCSFTTLRVSTSRHVTSHHPGTSCHRLLLLHHPEGEYVTSHHITRVHHVTACCSFTTLRFQLLSGNEGKQFHLHGGNGVITLVRHLEREVTSCHVLTVQVSDERGQTATATLGVDVEDVNDNAPVFKPAFSVIKLPKNSPPDTTLGQWRATDADEGSNAEVTYIKAGSSDKWAPFAVDNSTGVVRLVGDLNRQPTRGNGRVILLLKAVDGGIPPLSSTATVLVEIVKDEDYTPKFINTSGTVTIAEDVPLGVVLLQLQTTHAAHPDRVNYTLTTPGTPFQVLGDSGRVILRSTLDRELVQKYDLKFMARNDKGGSAFLEVKVLVQDVDDNDPVFSKSVYDFHVPHDTAADVIVGRVTVTDDDVGENANFAVNIVSGNGAGYFVLEGGALKTKRPLRYDDGLREFGLTLRARKPGRLAKYRYSEATVRIDVLPALSQPKFDANSITLTVKENVANNTVIGDLNATALGATEGESGPVRYVILSGNGKGRFHVEEYTGELQVVAGIDYEKDTEFVLTVVARNEQDFIQKDQKDTITVAVKVINVNDNSPQPGSALYRFSVKEGSSAGSFVGRVLFTDDDADLFGKFNLTISGCPQFDIDSSTGNITVKEGFSDVRFGCVVTATDGGDPPRECLTSVVIDVRSVNDHAPRFEGGPYSLEVSEKTAPGSTLTTIRATDPDEEGQVTVSIVSGDADGVFSLNASNGHLLLVSNLSAPQKSQYNLRLKAKDGGTPPQISFTTLTLKVIDVNDHAPLFAEGSRSQEKTVSRVVSPGAQLLKLKASDEDLGRNAEISFAIIEGNAEGLFFLDATTGQLSTRSWLTSAPTRHPLTLTATDHGYPPLSTPTTLTILLSPPSPNATQPVIYFQNLTTPEDAKVDSVVGVLDPFPLSRGWRYVITSGNHGDSFKVEMVDGGKTAKLLVKRRLDFEEYPVYFLWMSINGKGTAIRKLVQVNITDVNDNPPQFAHGLSLVLHVPEHTPAGHTVWSLSVRDADQSTTNGPWLFQVDSATVANVLTVTSGGQIQLLRSPVYDSLKQVDAVISVRDSTVPKVSSTISVTVMITDVDERELVTVTPALTMYISTEIAHNTKGGQIVHQLTVADFNLTQPSSSTVSFLFIDTKDAFSIHAKSGEVTVSDPQLLANHTVYFQWVVCKITEADGSTKSEIATLRIDTYDKYENIVAVQLELNVADLEAKKVALLGKLQKFFRPSQRVGIFDIISYGASARRRLLAANSLALIYVVDNVTSDALNNVMGPKTFLTRKQILQVLQQSPDGSPLSGLTGDSLSVTMVMPYLTGEPEESTPFTLTPYFPIIVAIICLLLVVICIFLICCFIYRNQRKRDWTPMPGFHIRKESMYPDDVSVASTTSLVDDDSGVGDSVGSRSLPRKSLTPSSSESEQSEDDEGGREEVALSANTLMNGQAPMSTTDSQKQPANSNDAEKPRRPRRKKKVKSQTDDCTNSKPPVSWLPPLPDDPHADHQGPSTPFPQSPRFGRRASGVNVDGYTPSNPVSPRRGSQNLDGASSRTGSEDSPSSSRRSSCSVDWATSPYAIPQSGRRASSARVTTPVFTTGISAVGLGLDPGENSTYIPSAAAASVENPLAMSSEARNKSSGSSSDGEYSGKITVPGHRVTWKPKRKEAPTIFHEKLKWKAVSTIPKVPRRARPAAGKGKNQAGPQAFPNTSAGP